MPSQVRQQMARSLGLFQALVALPPMFWLSLFAMEALFESRIKIYDFIASTFNGMFAAGIIFIVLVQRSVGMSRKMTVYFEEAKSGLATAMWLWLLLDTIFGPSRYYYSDPPPRGPRIIRAAISVIVLFILYYPTLVYAIFDDRMHESDGGVAEPEIEGEPAGERQPLLGQ